MNVTNGFVLCVTILIYHVKGTVKGILVGKCVICNKLVKEGTAHLAKYVIHEKCFKRVVPSSKEQKTGDEVV